MKTIRMFAGSLGLLVSVAMASFCATLPAFASPEAAAVATDSLSSSSAAPVSHSTTNPAGGPNALSNPAATGATAINPVRLNGLLQTWFVNDTTPSSVGSPNFVLRRAEIRASGEVTPQVRWFLMADPAKLINANGTATQDGRILQDLGIAYLIAPGLEITAGQFKTQTTAEGLDRSAELLLPERSIIGRTYGDRREPGAVLAYNRESIHASVMLSNGQGTNIHDNDGAKRASARLGYDLFEGQLQLGAFTQAQNFSYASGSHGLNLRLHWNALTLSTEGVIASDQTASGASLSANGMHVTAAWSLSEIFQPVARFETFSPDANNPSRGYGYTAGLNVYVRGNQAKIQAAYTYLSNFTFPGYRESYVDQAGGSDLIISLQASY